MCLILFAWRAHPVHLLVVAANRDEYFERPSSAAAFWDDAPEVLAGRDLTAQGTWLGVTRAGRFASITNYRNPAERMATAPSRGRLVTDFLTQGDRPSAYFAGVAPRAQEYNGFSMLAADGRSLAFFSNKEGVVRGVQSGVHGLSNHLLDTPWPKVESGKERLGALLDGPFDPEAYLQLLGDTEPAHDPHLPDTGVGIEWERRLSSIRIAGGHYGTRCSTLVRIGTDGKAEFWERSYDREGGVNGTVRYNFTVPAPASA
jgi:uncharacterized protein with NRDE domain